MSDAEKQREKMFKAEEWGMDDEADHTLLALSPMCVDCKHLRRWGVGRKCTAFPGGIPDEIWSGIVTHRKPYQGDGGVQYARREEV